METLKKGGRVRQKQKQHQTQIVNVNMPVRRRARAPKAPTRAPAPVTQVHTHITNQYAEPLNNMRLQQPVDQRLQAPEPRGLVPAPPPNHMNALIESMHALPARLFESYREMKEEDEIQKIARSTANRRAGQASRTDRPRPTTGASSASAGIPISRASSSASAGPSQIPVPRVHYSPLSPVRLPNFGVEEPVTLPAMPAPGMHQRLDDLDELLVHASPHFPTSKSGRRIMTPMRFPASERKPFK